MNRYPIWKYILILIALVFGALYTALNFFGESPAVQISSAKSTVKVESSMSERVETVLKQSGLQNTGVFLTSMAHKAVSVPALLMSTPSSRQKPRWNRH
jgi:preprotein translocase subunit SecD